MSKHTPGPWMVHRYVTGNGIAKHVGTVGCGLVASVGDHDARCGGLHKQYASACYEGLDRMAVMDANAALIADAPRLRRMADAGAELVPLAVDLIQTALADCADEEGFPCPTYEAQRDLHLEQLAGQLTLAIAAYEKASK